MICPHCKSEINLKERSTNQNRYYWGQVVGLIASETGHSALEIHEILRMMFLPHDTVNLKGNEFIVPKSTTVLSTIEMEEYLARIRAWASTELGIFITLPNEVANDTI